MYIFTTSNYLHLCYNAMVMIILLSKIEENGFMNTFKKRLCLCLALLNVSTFVLPALATDNSTEESQTGTVIVSPTASDVPQYVIDDLATANLDATVTIYNWVEDTEMVPSPRITWYEITEKKTVATHIPVSDKFVISVAKGHTRTLTSTWEASLSPSASVKGTESSLGLSATIKKTYSTKDVFTGPPRRKCL